MSNQFSEAEIENIKEEILEDNPNIKEGSVEFDEAFKEHCIGKDYYSYNGHPSLTDYARNR
jgi:hypothetical protein